MRKRDRTAEEKYADRLLRGGMLLLGASQPSQEAATPTPYPYVLAWDKEGRKGQRCQILPHKPLSRTVLVQFEDGYKLAVNRMAIRRQ
jgi:hypothetical protein